MEPTVQERMAGTVDREVMVVRVGRMGMLKIEDKAEQNQRGREGPRLLTISEISPLLLFGTYRWMCGLEGADVVKIFSHGEKTERSERKRALVSLCNGLSSLCYKRRGRGTIERVAYFE